MHTYSVSCTNVPKIHTKEEYVHMEEVMSSFYCLNSCVALTLKFYSCYVPNIRFGGIVHSDSVALLASLYFGNIRDGCGFSSFGAVLAVIDSSSPGI